MDELDIAGKQFISTRRAGKEHGYHSDYIGQLIRGGKVTGQKVGRAWYVDAQSLAVYLNKPYAAPEKAFAQVNGATENAVVLDKISETPSENQETAPIAEVVEKKAEIPVAETIVEQKAAEFVVAQEEKSTPVVEERLVPVHVSRPVVQTPPVEEKHDLSSGLVYIQDDAPSLPRIQTVHAQSTMPMAQAAVAFAPQKGGNLARMTAIVSVVGIAIVLGVGIAAYVSSGIKVAGETANVYYAIGQ